MRFLVLVLAGCAIEPLDITTGAPMPVGSSADFARTDPASPSDLARLAQSADLAQSPDLAQSAQSDLAQSAQSDLAQSDLAQSAQSDLARADLLQHFDRLIFD